MKQAQPYLRDILERIALIREFTSAGQNDFLNSRKTQESVIRCFEVIGEAVKRLPAELIGHQPQIAWKSFAGFRDVLIHQYDSIDLDEVWNTIESDLPSLQVAIQTLLESLDS